MELLRKAASGFTDGVKFWLSELTRGFEGKNSGAIRMTVVRK